MAVKYEEIEQYEFLEGAERDKVILWSGNEHLWGGEVLQSQGPIARVIRPVAWYQPELGNREEFVTLRQGQYREAAFRVERTASFDLQKKTLWITEWVGVKVKDPTVQTGSYSYPTHRLVLHRVKFVKKLPKKLNHRIDYYIAEDPDQALQEVLSFFRKI